MQRPDKKFWSDEIENAEKHFKSYFSVCDRIRDNYRSISTDANSDQYADTDRRFNVLWSNQQILQPATYSRMPEVVVERRHISDDQLANSAAELLSNALQYELEVNDADEAIAQARDDYLLYARGVLWCRYEMEKEGDKAVVFDDDGDDDDLDEDVEPDAQKTNDAYECVSFDYVKNADFLHSVNERWKEVWWVARKVPMTKDKLAERFPDTYEEIDFVDEAARDKEVLDVDVYEIWSRTHRMCYWYSARGGVLLGEEEPPYELEGFFPCPPPAYGTLTNDSLIPVPDFIYIQDESGDIDNMMGRIAELITALKTRGVYDENFTELRDLFNQGNNAMVPVGSFQEFAAKGGFSGAVAFMPTNEIVSTIKTLIELINYKTQVIYEKTGISDIVRGASEVGDTATAQGLKSRYASMRLEEKRKAIAKLIRNAIAIMGQIMAQLYSAPNLQLSAGVSFVPPPPNVMPGQPLPALIFPQMYPADFQSCIDLIRSKILRKYKIDIETDTTIAPDEVAQQQQVNGMLGVLGTFMGNAVTVGQQVPALVPVMAEAIKMLARSYRQASTLEPVLNQALQQLTQQAATPPQPQDTAITIAKLDQERKAMKDMADVQIKTEELKAKQMQAQADLQLKAAEMRLKETQIAQKQQEIQLEAMQEKRLTAKEMIDVSQALPL